jgi:hypothetical protein
MCSLDSCAFGHCEINWLWHGGRCVCKRGPDFSSLEMLIASIFAFRNLDQINGKNIHSGYISVKQLSGDLIVGVVLVRLAMKSDPAAVVSYVRDMTRYALNAAAAEYQTRGDVRGATDRADKAARYEHLEYHLLRESVRKKNVTSLIRDLNNLRTNIGASSPVQCKITRLRSMLCSMSRVEAREAASCSECQPQAQPCETGWIYTSLLRLQQDLLALRAEEHPLQLLDQ